MRIFAEPSNLFWVCSNLFFSDIFWSLDISQCTSGRYFSYRCVSLLFACAYYAAASIKCTFWERTRNGTAVVASSSSPSKEWVEHILRCRVGRGVLLLLQQQLGFLKNAVLDQRPYMVITWLLYFRFLCVFSSTENRPGGNLAQKVHISRDCRSDYCCWLCMWYLLQVWSICVGVRFLRLASLSPLTAAHTRLFKRVRRVWSCNDIYDGL